MAPATSPKAFDELQARLGAIWALNRPGVGVDHVMVALPSFSVGESLLSHYTTRIPALEHRYLLAQLVAHRIKGCEIVFVTCAPPGDVAVEYYLSLIPRERRQEVRSRIRLFVVPDRSARSVAAKLLDRPDIIERLRKSFRGRPAFIEPWNVTDAEVELALQLGAPLNGSAPDLWPLCFKSSGRKLFRQAGVPVAPGREDVRTAEDLVGAIGAIHRDSPRSSAFVVKLDDSGAGDGNVIIELGDTSRRSGMAEPIRGPVDAIPDWFMEELTAGGVAEELIQGARFSSPSVQIDIQPTVRRRFYRHTSRSWVATTNRSTWDAASQPIRPTRPRSGCMASMSASCSLHGVREDGAAWTSPPSSRAAAGRSLPWR